MSESASPAVSSIVTVRKLGMIMLYVMDPERSEKWYRDILGFERASEQYLSPGVTLQAADTLICLTRADAKREGLSRAGDFPGISLCFMVESVKRSYEAILAAGVTIAGDYFQPGPSFASLQIADPDENVLELWGNP
jgi:catechol 2,3-dioxygenase-like lactoylglutathione lyase family enzyme